ncbi:MAG: DNA primase [Paracoccaceae bacterium]|nr:DNA primase [Paracoccaceae bacterium]
MSLPAGFLDELRARASIAQVAGRKVAWDQKKTNINKGDYWAPCPFHQEKTASFHVDDKKGFYYCFGCQAKGDALGFIKETENVSFMEAVEILAQECGLQMPAQDLKSKEFSKKQESLFDIVEEASKFYKTQLHNNNGNAAQDYLNKRNLTKDLQNYFEIGFAPNIPNHLEKYLLAKNIPLQKIIDAGLVAESDDGSQSYDRFRNRIIFPIKDFRGRTIAFGGRALDPKTPAKYINSPETMLFDKGKTLYNYRLARNNLNKQNKLIVAEGYMDVIALNGGGFDTAVAPLGTAITEYQLRLLWRLTDEPIVALDGDKAGINAAMRAIDLALPILSIGKSLRFAMLPQGQDPDDIIQSQGAEKMKEIINNAVPMIDLLWQRELEVQTLDSPDRKAAFDASLKRITKRIVEPSIRDHYFAAFKSKRAQLLNTSNLRTARNRKGASINAFATLGTKASALALDSSNTRLIRETVILAILISYPELIEEFSYHIEKMDWQNITYKELIETLLSLSDEQPSEIRDKLNESYQEQILIILDNPHAKISPALRKTGKKEIAIKTLREEFMKLETYAGMQKEIRDAIDDLNSASGESLTWRLNQATKARTNAEKSTLDEIESAGEDKTAMTDFLQNLIDNEVWVKKNK